jgi:hypothetical protein
VRGSGADDDDDGPEIDVEVTERVACFLCGIKGFDGARIKDFLGRLGCELALEGWWHGMAEI